MKYLLSPIIFVFLFTINVFTQQTQYDLLPEIDPMYKPAWSEDYPSWAKMMYQNDVNFHEIEDLYLSDNSIYKQKCPIHRYYKIWKKAVRGFVNNDGSIHLPNISDFHENLKKSWLTTQTKSDKNADLWRFIGPVETFWLNEHGNPDPPAPCSWQANVYSFDVAPSDHNVLYAGTETGFLNKSTDRGMSWDLIGKRLFIWWSSHCSRHPSL